MRRLRGLLDIVERKHQRQRRVAILVRRRVVVFPDQMNLFLFLENRFPQPLLTVTNSCQTIIIRFWDLIPLWDRHYRCPPEQIPGILSAQTQTWCMYTYKVCCARYIVLISKDQLRQILSQLVARSGEDRGASERERQERQEPNRQQIWCSSATTRPI